MNKLLSTTLVIIVSLISSYGLQAQSNTSLGLRVGLNVANLTGENVNTEGPRNGLLIGGFYTHSISNDFGISGELLYSQQGARGKTATGQEFTAELNYLQIPVYGNYFLKVSDAVYLKLMFGPTVGILLDAEQDFENGNSVETTDSYNSADYGLLGGVGMHYSLGNKMWLNLDARYNLGLATVSENADIDINNSVFSLVLGLSFGL